MTCASPAAARPARARRSLLLAVAAACGLLAAPASANLLTNAGFEVFDPTSAVWSGWDRAIYNGGSGAALTTGLLFDTTGFGASLAAGYQVGGDGAPGGFRVTQSFTVASAGSYDVALDVASQNTGAPGTGGNADGGTFALLVDGVAVDSFSVGPLLASLFARDHLAGVVTLSAGIHTFEIDMYRSFLFQNSGVLLFNDDAVVEAVAGVTPVPEPGTWALIAIGMGAIGWRRKQATRA